MRPGPSSWPRPDCNCSAHCCGTQCLCRNTTGEPMRYCACDGSDPSCHVKPVSANPPCPRGTNPGRTHRFYQDRAVVPFGFGLSYTRWSYRVVGAPLRAASLEPVRRLLRDSALEATVGSGSTRGWLTDKVTFPSLEAARDKNSAPVNYVVNVSNIGSIDADDVVLGFLVPPGAGSNGVPLQTLFGFERVHVKAGQSVSVTIYPSLTDFTHVTLQGERVPLAGEYSVRFGLKETRALGQGFAEHKLTMKTDDAPGR